MKTCILIAASCTAFATAACSGNKGQDSNQSNNQAAATGNSAFERRPASAEQLGRVVDCAATFESVATLYRVMGERSSGPDGERMIRSATQRAAVAEEMETRAATIGTALGLSQADVDARLRQARERLQRESRAGDFSEFAVRMGREADRCVAAMPELL